jgi:hypothetical protein
VAEVVIRIRQCSSAGNFAVSAFPAVVKKLTVCRMKFSHLASAIGQRIDDKAVESLVTSVAGKVPLKGKKDGFFSAKKQNLEIGWSSEILSPAYYPSKKEGNKAIYYVDTIWFEPGRVDGLPHGLTISSPPSAYAKIPNVSARKNRMGDTVYRWPVGDRATLCVTIDENGEIDKRWLLQVTSYTRYDFIRSSVHSHAFSPWNPAWPKEQSDLPLGMFMAWCIDRGHIGERHRKDNAKLVDAVRSRTITGREFLYQVAYHNEVWSWDFSTEIDSFVHTYLNCLCHRNSSSPLLGKADRCGVNDDFMAIFDSHLPGRGLNAADDWTNYDRFALFIDARLADYQLTDLETDLEPSAKTKVTAIYKAAQAKMAKLPLPVALTTTANVAPVAIDGLTERLLAMFARLTDDEAVLSLVNEFKLTLPTVTWNSYLDAPQLGFFLKLIQPWSHDRLGEKYKATQSRLRRNKTKLVEAIEFTNQDYANISNSTGNFIACQKYLAHLPLGFSFNEDLAAVDKRMGSDEFNEHTWDTYDNDGSLTRKWRTKSLAGAPKASYIILATYEKYRLMSLRIVMQ